MDSSRTQRYGKPYYRSNFMPPNARQVLEDRLHPPGISSSSNSSWTFSNSHCDVPKPRKGRLCGICLIGAVLVVALAVIAIGGLAFYIGGYTTEKHQLSDYQTKDNVSAKRQYSSKHSESTRKPTSQSSTKVFTSEKTQKEITTEQSHTKPIPEGAIFGISETMKQLKNIKNKKKEEQTTTEAYEEISTFVYENEEQNQSTENVELVPADPTLPIKTDEVYRESLTTESKSNIQNGHARPTYGASITTAATVVETTTKPLPTSTSSLPPKKDYSEEPWRPIIPPYRDTIRIKNPFKKENMNGDFQRRNGTPLIPPLIPPVIDNDSPITFSKESYEQNLKVTPEFTGGKFQNYNSRISEEIATKYKDLVRTGSSEGVAEIVVSSDDVVTGQHTRPSNVILVSEVRTPSIQTTTEELDVRKEQHPIGIDQIISGVSLIENNVETSTKNRMTETVSSRTNEPTEGSSKTVTSEVVPTVPASSPEPHVNHSRNSTVTNPFEDDSRSSSSNFNFGIPELPLLKQFHHLDSLFKSFAKPTPDTNNSRYFVADANNETAATRFPVRTKQTTIKSYKKEDMSTITPLPTTEKQSVVRRPVIVKGEVEVVSAAIKHTHPHQTPTTEVPKLITLLPVRSNVNMMRPLRPRPKSNSTVTNTTRKAKMNSFSSSDTDPPHHWLDDKRWLYHSNTDEKKVFVVTPEPKARQTQSDTPANLTDLPLYNTIETLLNLDQRKRPEGAPSRNTSDIVQQIVKVVEKVAISTGDSPLVVVKVNQTVVKSNATKEKNQKDMFSLGEGGGPETNALPPQYKVNEAGVAVLRKILRKAPVPQKTEVSLADHLPGCDEDSMKCRNGTCIPLSKKCDRYIDCPNAEDERKCTCSEHLKSQGLERKLCDGVVDCWDFSDEYNCKWCQKEFLCSNSKVCIKKSQICDGENNCPFGDDEKRCVTVAPSTAEAETLDYHNNGYLMVRKNGNWAKLCVDNFDSVSVEAKTGWKISDLGRAVCRALTFKDFDKVERMTSVPNEGRAAKNGIPEKYFELSYSPEPDDDGSSSRESVLRFREATCPSKQVVRVVCVDLECGLRPQAIRQWPRKISGEHLRKGSRRSRIVGGGNAGPGSWPWQAALYREGEYQCGGTLVSENWLISAGHCFYHNQEAYWVARLGTLRTSLLLPSPYEQLRQISKIVLHPHYVDNGFINDISLLKMRDPVKFTDYVRPICLPKADATIVDGTMCTVVGWGQLSEVGWVFPDTLQEVQLPILSSSECRKRTIFLPLYKITDDMFCAGYERGGRDACLGDSGGPLMCPGPNGRWTFFGITSNGYGCARSNRPGVYTKVSKYLHWIQSQMSLHSETTTEAQEPADSSGDENEPTLCDGNQDHVAKLISQKLSNVKLSVASKKSGDKCKGHRCPLGECLPRSRLCNGHIECSDGSDEKDCW